MLAYGGPAGVTIRSCATLAGNKVYDGGLHHKIADYGTTQCGDDTFALTVPFGGIGSVPCTTAKIHYTAVAEIKDEDEAAALAGGRPGESMQAKLQACANVGQVRVRRSPADASGGYQWIVTFAGAPGNLAEMSVAQNNLAVPGATVRVATVQEGNDNRYYNYAGKLAQLEGRIAPANCDALGSKCNAAWLLVLPNTFSTV